MRVKARALIVVDGKVAVDRQSRYGRDHLALPGGRVDRWETVTEALVREIREELGLEIKLDRLLYVFEATHRYRLQDVNLVFLADLLPGQDTTGLQLVDPRTDAAEVLPPILDVVARDLEVGFRDSPRWLGNLWKPRDEIGGRQ